MTDGVYTERLKGIDKKLDEIASIQREDHDDIQKMKVQVDELVQLKARVIGFGLALIGTLALALTAVLQHFSNLK